jgi:hypothetical protein
MGERVRLGLLVLAALGAIAAGGLVAAAGGSGAASRPPASRPLPASPLPAAPFPASPLMALAAPTRLAPPVQVGPCRRPATGSPAQAPSRELLATFGVLRRPATSADSLPAEAAKALEARGLEMEGAGAARLLRTGPDGGRAWVVPVRDARGPLSCFPRPGGRGTTAATDGEGLAVVALGDAPAGGGGTRVDLARGTAPVSVDRCTGADHTSTEISGIVPDGVSAVYLTAADGTAVRADVRGNSFVLLIPVSRVPEQRYVVWSGAGGTPHVQPVFADAFPARLCRHVRVLGASVTPPPFPCAPSPATVFSVPTRPRPARPLRLRRPSRPLRVPPAAAIGGLLAPWCGSPGLGLPPTFLVTRPHRRHH